MASTSIVDMMIVGAHKAGTSALLRYLGSHPGIRAQVRPEMVYFMDADLCRRDLATYRERYFGVASSPSDLDLVHVGKLAGLMYEPEGLERLRRHNPEVEIAVMLRDPVHRAYSAFWFNRLKGREPLASFEEALYGDRARFGADHKSASICDYLDRGLYAKRVEGLYERFGRDQVHVLILEEFRQDSATTVGPLLRHVGLDATPLPPLSTTENVARRARSFQLARLVRPRSAAALTAKRILPQRACDAIRNRWRRFNEMRWSPPPMEPVTENDLRTYFAKPNRDLEQLLGRDLSGIWPGPK